MLSSLPHYGDYVAQEEAEVLQFPIDELIDLISRDPRLFFNLVKVGEAELDEACLNNIPQARTPAHPSEQGCRAGRDARKRVQASPLPPRRGWHPRLPRPARQAGRGGRAALSRL